jgi:hypothetical protein
MVFSTLMMSKAKTIYSSDWKLNVAHVDVECVKSY